MADEYESMTQLVEWLKQEFTDAAWDGAEEVLGIPVSREMRKWLSDNWEDVRKELESQETDMKDVSYKCADQYFKDMCNFRDPKFEEAETMDDYPWVITDRGQTRYDLKELLTEVAEKYFDEIMTDAKTRRMEQSNEDDIISHPNHYCKGRKYEPKDVIHDWGLDFNLGSAVKYLSRAGRKEHNSKQQDLEKAIQYIQFELEEIKKEQANDQDSEELAD